MNRRFFFILFFAALITAFAFHFPERLIIPAIENTSVWQRYDKYKEPTIDRRMVSHADVVRLIGKHTSTGLFKSELLGESVQGRSINHLQVGSGKTKVLLWSQMHGDESTATMALFDIFNFLQSQDENDGFRREILQNLDLHFVPMLNPDGAEAWKRRNALEIDINRDARLQNTPEGRALTKLAADLKPQFGFNLHDQSTLYAAGETANTATISFLAPAYDYAKSMNDVRKNATRLIVSMNRTLQKYAPGKVAKYNDAHDPRCFGDRFQGQGISTILIESGGYPDDPEKQYIRKLNFYVILSALHSIATKTYQDENIENYKAIPENSRSLYDLILRNAEVRKGSISYRTNIGINRSQIPDTQSRTISYKGSIEEIADMDRMFGYAELDAGKYKTETGKVKMLSKAEWELLDFSAEADLLKQGYLYVKLTDANHPTGPVKSHLLNLTNATSYNNNPIGIGQSANFFLTLNNKPEYAVINGYLVNLNAEIKALPNVFSF